MLAPAYAANMAAPFAQFWKGWNRPIHERRLGGHKTVIGAVAGVFAAVATSLAQWAIGWEGSILSSSRWPLTGLLLGVGAMAGDALKSLVKRRAGIPPGERWIPFDQLDFVVGALALVTPLAAISWRDMAVVLAISFVGSIVVNQIAFRIGVKNTGW